MDDSKTMVTGMIDDATASARPVDVLLARYAESHRDPTNELIHFVCVPVIMLSLLGMLWAGHPLVAAGVAAAALAYYWKLSRPFAAGMLVMALLMLGVLAALPPIAVLPLSIAMFVLAWAGQFIGHLIEGRKPSFFDDVRFLLIGPLFVLGFLYRRLGVVY
ncbi:Mpo1-like protein [Massilia sp. METH4]|uniref:Mpo1 family 2-hydroxy fatty acid dioxygenase n=1 Tax=Massilia sp. METH4 TaxID=3123041 RepID=UPI0030CA6E22